MECIPSKKVKLAHILLNIVTFIFCLMGQFISLEFLYLRFCCNPIFLRDQVLLSSRLNLNQWVCSFVVVCFFLLSFISWIIDGIIINRIDFTSTATKRYFYWTTSSLISKIYDKYCQHNAIVLFVGEPVLLLLQAKLQWATGQ